MQTHRADTPEEVTMMKLLSKIQTLEAQKSLLEETIKKKVLLNSKIISSLQPKVGKQFVNTDIELRKQRILADTRKKLILLAIDEKEIELQQSQHQFDQMKVDYISNNENPDQFLNKMDALMNALTQRLNISMNKKVSFHAGREQTTVTFVKKRCQVKKKRKWTANRKRKNRIN